MIQSREPGDTEQSNFIPKGHNPSSTPMKVLPDLQLQVFLMTPAICFFLKVSTKEGGVYYSNLFSSGAVARTTNWHPVLYPGVHAEARPVPAEHLSGPVPAAAPQEGPHTAQVHRGRNVRALSIKKPLIQITRKIVSRPLHSHTSTAPRKTLPRNLNIRALACYRFIYSIYFEFALRPLTSLWSQHHRWAPHGAHSEKYPQASWNTGS